LRNFSAAVLTAFALLVINVKHAGAQGNGSNHSQNIHENNGIAVQSNVVVNLRKAARESMLDERGWMRLLTPANEQDPPNPCEAFESLHPIDKTAVAVFYGTNVAYCKKETCVIVDAARGDVSSPLLTVHKVKTGIVVDAKIFDKDGNIIADIEGNKPHLNKTFVSDFNRPDEHSLWIKDNHDKQVLYVRFLNRSSIYIEGIFNLPDEVRAPTPPHTFIEISKDSFASHPGGDESGDCHNGVGLSVVRVNELH
jgi:hypothetical protein